MDTLLKAAAEQGNGWIAFGFAVLLVVALLWHIRRLGDQEREDRQQAQKDRALMVQVIESNTTFMKMMKEEHQKTQENLRELHGAIDRQSRNSEETANSLMAVTYSIKGLQEIVHFYVLGKRPPPLEGER